MVQNESKKKLEAGSSSNTNQDMILVVDTEATGQLNTGIASCALPLVQTQPSNLQTSALPLMQACALPLVQTQQINPIIVTNSYLLPWVETEVEDVSIEARVLLNALVAHVDDSSKSVDEYHLEGTSVLDPKPKLAFDVLPLEKDYHTESEGDNLAKKKYTKKCFEKVRSSSRVHTQATKFSL